MYCVQLHSTASAQPLLDQMVPWFDNASALCTIDCPARVRRDGHVRRPGNPNASRLASLLAFLLTCLVAACEQRVFVNSAAKIIVHPAVAELGSIPENKGRTVKELKRSELLHRAVVVALAVVMMVALAVVMMVVSVRTGTSC